MLRGALNKMGTATPALQLQMFKTLVCPILPYACQI